MDDIIALDVRPDGICFDFGDNYDSLSREIDALVARYEDGQLKPARYVTALREFITRHPNYIEASAHLALALLDQEKPRQALEAAQRGFRIGEKAIPAGFNGLISWRHLTNSSFLQVADALAHAHVANGEHREAAAVMEKMLAWNPDDQQGVTLRIGAVYLRIGEKDKAKAAFEKAMRFDAAAHYELGLLHIIDGDLVSAATALRRGFVETPYVAELLCGAMGALEPFVIGDGLHDVERALDYVEAESELWTKTDHATPFLNWLYHHPKAMLERAAILDLREQRFWENDMAVCDRLEQREDALRAAIDDELSRDLVKPRHDREGKTVLPWMVGRDQPA